MSWNDIYEEEYARVVAGRGSSSSFSAMLTAAATTTPPPSDAARRAALAGAGDIFPLIQEMIFAILWQTWPIILAGCLFRIMTIRTDPAILYPQIGRDIRLVFSRYWAPIQRRLDPHLHDLHMFYVRHWWGPFGDTLRRWERDFWEAVPKVVGVVALLFVALNVILWALKDPKPRIRQMTWTQAAEAGWDIPAWMLYLEQTGEYPSHIAHGKPVAPRATGEPYTRPPLEEEWMTGTHPKRHYVEVTDPGVAEEVEETGTTEVEAPESTSSPDNQPESPEPVDTSATVVEAPILTSQTEIQPEPSDSGETDGGPLSLNLSEAIKYWAPPDGTSGARTTVGDQTWCRVCKQFHCCELPY